MSIVNQYAMLPNARVKKVVDRQNNFFALTQYWRRLPGLSVAKNKNGLKKVAVASLYVPDSR